jgi:MYXO-CTERM domain-containing protein
MFAVGVVRVRLMAAGAALGALLLAAHARADMGPSCKCRATSVQSERGGLAAAIGIGGVLFLLVDRRRRVNDSKPR